MFEPDRTLKKMRLRAFAKINVGLHIVGRRPDGYHDIETIFHQINLSDELEMVQSEEGDVFTSDSPELASGSSNLCLRAVHILRDLTGVHTGVEINLKKRIPIAAGLGGGSADAAAVLKGLTRLWTLDITDEELKTVSATLGSDVPFFLTGGTAYATGRGERLEPLDVSIPYWILVVTPLLHVSTTWAYTSLKIVRDARRVNLPDLLRKNISHPDVLREKLCNEFEPLVFAAHPEVRHIKEGLLKAGAQLALMSGSGSSIFGFFSDRGPAQSIAKDFSSRYHTSITQPLFKPEPN
jgi:4-diphosphocytidyl-2-C-methyl-D-erythritol kinase